MSQRMSFRNSLLLRSCLKSVQKNNYKPLLSIIERTKKRKELTFIGKLLQKGERVKDNLFYSQRATVQALNS